MQFCGSSRARKRWICRNTPYFVVKAAVFIFWTLSRAMKNSPNYIPMDIIPAQDSNQFGYTNYKEDVDLIILTAIQRYRLITSKIKAKEGLKLLDIGCAYGYYLDLARLYGWDVTALSSIPRQCVRPARLLSLILSSAGSRTTFLKTKFDLVTCWDLIEHLQDPKALFQET